MNNTTKIPTQVYAEMTPNPATMKFVSDRLLIENGEQLDLISQVDAKKYSPLAAELFNFPFVTGIFIASTFVTVTKDESLGWEMIVQQLRDYIREWLVVNEIAVTSIPENSLENCVAPNLDSSDSSVIKSDFEKSEYDDEIKQLLNDFVKPAVEQDGGAIDFLGFDKGVVYVQLKGACAGCPSSTQTLKGGIETLLKSKLDVITDVVANS